MGFNESRSPSEIVLTKPSYQKVFLCFISKRVQQHRLTQNQLLWWCVVTDYSLDLVACNSLCAMLYLRLMCNDVHMSSLLPLPGQRFDGDADVQQKTCLGIKDTHPPWRTRSVLPTGSLTIMRLRVSGSLANGSQALINERWRLVNLQVLPHSQTDGGSKRQARAHTLKGILQGIHAGFDWLFLPSAPFDLLSFWGMRRTLAKTHLKKKKREDQSVTLTHINNPPAHTGADKTHSLFSGN